MQLHDGLSRNERNERTCGNEGMRYRAPRAACPRSEILGQRARESGLCALCVALPRFACLRPSSSLVLPLCRAHSLLPRSCLAPPVSAFLCACPRSLLPVPHSAWWRFLCCLTACRVACNVPSPTRGGPTTRPLSTCLRLAAHQALDRSSLLSQLPWATQRRLRLLSLTKAPTWGRRLLLVTLGVARVLPWLALPQAGEATHLGSVNPRSPLLYSKASRHPRPGRGCLHALLHAG